MEGKKRSSHRGGGGLFAGRGIPIKSKYALLYLSLSLFSSLGNYLATRTGVSLNMYISLAAS